MAVGTVSGVNPDEQWQLIATNTMSAATSTTFSSLSGYKTYIIVTKNLTQSGASYGIIRFNGDSTAGNYGSSAFWDNGQNQYTNTGIASWGFAGGGVGGFTTYTIVRNADSALPKITETHGYLTHNGNGIWVNTSAITSISFTASTGTFTGDVLLYGIPA